MSDINLALDKLVLSKAYDTISLSETRRKPCFYGFLNEHESQLIKDNIYFNDGYMLWGGYDEAQRVFFGVGVNSHNEFPFKAIEFKYKEEYELSHRDFLGSLMSLGIERSAVGDILVSKGSSTVFIKDSIVDFVVNEIDKVGRIGVEIFEKKDKNIDFVSNYEIINFTVSSLRLDVFVSAVCNLSRANSQKYIKSEFVTVNHMVNSNFSKSLNEGDVVTIKKYGKFVFIAEEGVTKKGRLRIRVKHFR